MPFVSCVSSHYVRFKSYCCEAYNLLRKSSSLILNLFHLMAGANIPDIAQDPHKGMLKVEHTRNDDVNLRVDCCVTLTYMLTSVLTTVLTKVLTTAWT